MMAIYENIKDRCRKQKRSVLSIENKLGFARGSIYKWNESPPGVFKIKAVADELGCTIEELVSD